MSAIELMWSVAGAAAGTIVGIVLGFIVLFALLVAWDNSEEKKSRQRRRPW